MKRKNNLIPQKKKSYSRSIFQETIRNIELLKLPININNLTTEEYYLELTLICRNFIKEEYFIRATEMTSEEIAMYFRSIGIKDELINTWTQANEMANMAKYAGQIPNINQFHKDKEDFLHIIKSFLRSERHIEA